jgi:Flp pilus assembly protein TadG
MVTAETAMALPALLLVLGFAITIQSVVAARAACADAARAGARAAARGESDTVVVETVRRAFARADAVRVRRDGPMVRVEVVARPAAIGTHLPVPAVSADATAADETAVR